MKLRDILNERNTALALDKEVRRFIAMKDKRSKVENEKQLTNIINKHVDTINSVKDKFYTKITNILPKKGSSQNFQFIYQVKTIGSIIDKVLNRNVPIDKLTDIVRGAVLFSNVNELNKFIKDLKRKSSDIVVDVDYKEKGKDSTYGYYGVYHVDMNIDGIDVELQVMPKKLWTYKAAAHNIYNKWRSKNQKIDKFDSNLSKKLFRLGNITETVVIGDNEIEISLLMQ